MPDSINDEEIDYYRFVDKETLPSGALSGTLNPDSPATEAYAFRYYGLVRKLGPITKE